MKKILTSVLCIGLAAATLVSCSGKKTASDAENKKTSDEPILEVVETLTPEEPEEIEEEQVFEYEVVYTGMTASLSLKAYNGEDEELTIPSEYEDEYEGLLPVTAIGNGVFLGNETLKSVVVPEGVTSIGLGAFQNCSALIDVVLPESLETIGENAFYNSAIENINIPASVTSIGYHAFSSQLNPTPWYDSLKAEKVIVGDGILLKYNIPKGAEQVDISGVKRIAYDAFSNPGNLSVLVDDSLLAIDKNAVFIPASSDTNFKFLVPYDSFAEEALAETSYIYEIIGAPAPIGNPFVWTFDDASSMDSWYNNSMELSYDKDGVIHGEVVLNEEGQADAIFSCEDELNLPAESFKTMVVRMKHNITTEITEENKTQLYFQVYYNNGSGLSEANSVKQNITTSSGDEFIEYRLNLADATGWDGIINYFRIDTPNHMAGEFWFDSVVFEPVSEDIVFDELLKPITKNIPDPENPYYFKFAEEELANAWPTSGIDYSYDAETETIHGFVKADEESFVLSPELNAPAYEYRNLIVRMRHAFDVEKTEENAADFNIKVFVDSGAGFPEETPHVLAIEQTSNDEKVEYEFLLKDADGNWYENVKAIKIVPCSNMGGEFWIDKVEIEPEHKLTRADFISMLYEADEKPAAFGESKFRDVVIYDDYHSAIVWAVEKGLIAVESRYFEPDSLITAEDYAKLLKDFVIYKGLEGEVEAFEGPVYEMDAQDQLDALLGVSEEE